MANKYEEAYKKSYKGLKGQSEDITSRGKSYAGYTGEVSALPYQLKEEFRQRRDPAFDKRVRESEQQVLGGAIEGLNKYQDIQNPFNRRALAEKYQSGMSTSLQGLYDERERRQGTILDYIDKWTGLFGAEAKKEELTLNAMKEGWQRDSGMAAQEYGATSTGLQQEESRDRWNQEFQLNKDKFAFSKAQAGRSSSLAASKKIDQTYLQKAQEALENSKEMTKDENYHSDVFRQAWQDAPNSATRDALQNMSFGGVDDKGKQTFGFYKGNASNEPAQWEVEAKEIKDVGIIMQELRARGNSEKEIKARMIKDGYGKILEENFDY